MATAPFAYRGWQQRLVAVASAPLPETQTYLVEKNDGVFGRNVVAVTVPIQFDVIGRTFPDINDAVTHRRRFRKPRRHRRPVTVETGVVTHFRRIHFRRPYVVEVLGDYWTQHRARPQVRFRPGTTLNNTTLICLLRIRLATTQNSPRTFSLGAGEDARDAVYVCGREQFARQRHVSHLVVVVVNVVLRVRLRRLRTHQLLYPLIGEQLQQAII